MEDNGTTSLYPCILQRPAHIHQLNFYIYGCVTQAICVLGIIGNILNLIVLTRPKMKAVCYIYMRAKAVTDLVAIIFTFPWAAKHLKSIKLWQYYGLAFYHSYFELYLMNSFVAAGIFLMLAITIERFVSVCYPLKARTMVGGNRRAYITSASLIVISLFLFIPYAFQSQVETYEDRATNTTLYTYCENLHVITLTSWKFYRWAQQAVCRFAPVILIAILNVSIVVGFRRIVKKRQKMKGKSRNQADFREQRRLTFMLLGLSVMFFICEIPAAVLIGQISGTNKRIYGFQIFRAVANMLEIVNYTFSFYAYCLASSEFRRVFWRIIALRGLRANCDNECTSEVSCSRSKIDSIRLASSPAPLNNANSDKILQHQNRAPSSCGGQSISTINGQDISPSLPTWRTELSSLNSITLTKYNENDKF